MLANIVISERITFDIDGLEKRAALALMIEIFDQTSGNRNVAHVIANKLFEREDLASTGIGLGIAVPHVRHPLIESQSLVIGIARSGIDYGSIDDAPVHFIAMLLSPLNANHAHLQILSEISTNLRVDAYRNKLFAATTADDVLDQLTQAKDSDVTTTLCYES